MIDFQNASLLKLKPTDNSDYAEILTPMLADGEDIFYSFRGIRDAVVFTNKRIFAINIQGLTGKKKDFTSLPYKKIQAYSIETSGMIDLDSELELWFSSLGIVRLEFVSRTDVNAICRLISQNVL